jgi:SAM-dependent methyltransferase
MSLLDVGCGPGTITIDLARRLLPGRVVGLDASAAILAEAAGRTGEDDAAVEWQAGDVYDLPFEDGSFDVVHAHQVLQHLADPVAALREMGRVTAPAGVVAARDGDYAAMTWWPPEPALARWVEVYRAVARANGGEPDAGRRLLAWAHAAGLRAVRASASAWCFASPEERAWWSGLWAERITDSPLADRACELGIADGEELGRLAEGWRRWAADDDAWFCVPNSEIRCRVGDLATR